MTDTVIFQCAYVQNCLISTSGLKSDVTIVFLDPICSMMQEFRRFMNIVGKNWYIYVCMDYQDLLAQNDGFWGKIREGVV